MSLYPNDSNHAISSILDCEKHDVAALPLTAEKLRYQKSDRPSTPVPTSPEGGSKFDLCQAYHLDGDRA